jgi:hypothetical protein
MAKKYTIKTLLLLSFFTFFSHSHQAVSLNLDLVLEEGSAALDFDPFKDNFETLTDNPTIQIFKIDDWLGKSFSGTLIFERLNLKDPLVDRTSEKITETLHNPLPDNTNPTCKLDIENAIKDFASRMSRRISFFAKSQIEKLKNPAVRNLLGVGGPVFPMAKHRLLDRYLPDLPTVFQKDGIHKTLILRYPIHLGDGAYLIFNMIDQAIYSFDWLEFSDDFENKDGFQMSCLVATVAPLSNP